MKKEEISSLSTISEFLEVSVHWIDAISGIIIVITLIWALFSYAISNLNNLTGFLFIIPLLSSI